MHDQGRGMPTPSRWARSTSQPAPDASRAGPGNPIRTLLRSWPVFCNWRPALARAFLLCGTRVSGRSAQRLALTRLAPGSCTRSQVRRADYTRLWAWSGCARRLARLTAAGGLAAARRSARGSSR